MSATGAVDSTQAAASDAGDQLQKHRRKRPTQPAKQSASAPPAAAPGAMKEAKPLMLHRNPLCVDQNSSVCELLLDVQWLHVTLAPTLGDRAKKRDRARLVRSLANDVPHVVDELHDDGERDKIKILPTHIGAQRLLHETLLRSISVLEVKPGASAMSLEARGRRELAEQLKTPCSTATRTLGRKH